VEYTDDTRLAQKLEAPAAVRAGRFNTDLGP
jgi:hypothetical protein